MSSTVATINISMTYTATVETSVTPFKLPKGVSRKRFEAAADALRGFDSDYEEPEDRLMEIFAAMRAVK